MKKLFYYCYYRISKFYEDWGESNGHVAGGVVLFGCVGFNVASIITICMYLINKELNNELLGVVFISFAIASIPFISKKKYDKLYEEYRNERRSKLKGWLIFVYFIFSIVSYILIVNIFRYIEPSNVLN